MEKIGGVISIVALMRCLATLNSRAVLNVPDVNFVPVTATSPHFRGLVALRFKLLNGDIAQMTARERAIMEAEAMG